MQSEEYINGCAAFRDTNIRKKNSEKQSDSKAGETELADSKLQENLHYTAEASLSLQDVSTYYSPWDMQSRQLHLKPPTEQLLIEMWKVVEADLGPAEVNSAADSPVLPSLPHSHAEDNIVIYLNKMLDPAIGLGRLPLSSLDSLLERVVLKQTGVDSFKPTKKCYKELHHLLESYDLVTDSYKAIGNNHKYHFRKRGRDRGGAIENYGSFSFNAFIAAVHKHPMVTLL